MHPTHETVVTDIDDQKHIPQADERPEVVVITGMSGAGRTNVAKVLEDEDYFVIDNLPPPLISRVVELAFAPGASVRRLAVVADVRGREFFGALAAAVQELQQGHEANVRLVFLEADDNTLVARFNETRRRHPAAEAGDDVQGGITRERALLADLRGQADLVIDTSTSNVHELRGRVSALLGSADTGRLRVKVVSFGFKYGSPREAEVVIDVRFLPNPHWIKELREHNGLQQPVREFVLGHPGTAPFLERFKALLDVLIPGYETEGKRYLTVAIGCTGGKHRSVAITEAVGAHLRDATDLDIRIQHRDLGNE
ncbi:MAG: UPF0042 nucleotide-binding protein [Myxococcota bacterium]|jgi:UPF0042 nucleotide-binding protein